MDMMTLYFVYAIMEVTRNTQAYMKYNVYCLIIVIQQSITLSHWIPLTHSDPLKVHV